MRRVVFLVLCLALQALACRKERSAREKDLFAETAPAVVDPKPVVESDALIVELEKADANKAKRAPGFRSGFAGNVTNHIHPANCPSCAGWTITTGDGVEITARDVAGNVAGRAVADHAGDFAFAAAPGTYTLVADKVVSTARFDVRDGSVTRVHLVISKRR